MTEGQVIAEAERAARQGGYRLDDYERVGVTSDDRGSSVFYELKPPGRPGGHFSVRVDATGATSIVPGR